MLTKRSHCVMSVLLSTCVKVVGYSHINCPFEITLILAAASDFADMETTVF